MNNTKIFKNIEISHFITQKALQSDFTEHHHTNYEMLFVKKGSGIFLVEGQSFKMEKNSIFLIPSGRYHVVKINEKTEYDRWVINFSDEIIPPFLHIDNYISTIATENISSLFDKFENYCKKFNNDEIQILLTSLLNEVLILLSHKLEKTPEEFRMSPIIQKTLAYISENIERSFTINDISENLFISETHLQHIFSKSMHTSIMQYVKLKKMYKAREYLLLGYAPTKVASLLDYKDYPNFYKHYKSIFNISPSKVKKC